MRIVLASLCLALFLLVPAALAQTLTLVAPLEGATITHDPSAPYASVTVEWQMVGAEPGVQGSFSLDGQPAVLRSQVEPIVFFIPAGTHQLVAHLQRADGTPIPGTQQTRSFTVGAGSAPNPYAAPSYQMPPAPVPSYESPPAYTPSPAEIPGYTPAPSLQYPSQSQLPSSPAASASYPGMDYVASPAAAQPVSTEEAIPAKALPVAIPWSTQLIAGVASGFIVLILGSTLLVIRGKKGSGAPGGIDPATYQQLIQYVKQYQTWYPPSTLAAELTKSGYNQETISAALREAQQTVRQQQPQYPPQQSVRQF